MMTVLSRFDMLYSSCCRQSHYCLAVLAVFLVFGIMLNTRLDADCLQSQTLTCRCYITSTASETTELPSGTCMHCTECWVSMLLSPSRPMTPPLRLVLHTPVERSFGACPLERPPIYS